MLSRKARAISTLSAIVFSLASGAAAEDFKSSKFLTYPADSQKSFINSSVVMASLIASENSRSQADCLNAWSAKHVGDGYQPVLDAMRRFLNHHPTGVVLAVLQKACGPFRYSPR